MVNDYKISKSSKYYLISLMVECLLIRSVNKLFLFIIFNHMTDMFVLCVRSVDRNSVIG